MENRTTFRVPLGKKCTVMRPDLKWRACTDTWEESRAEDCVEENFETGNTDTEQPMIAICGASWSGLE